MIKNIFNDNKNELFNYYIQLYMYTILARPQAQEHVN